MTRSLPLLALFACQALLTATLVMVFIAIVSSDLRFTGEAVLDVETWITAGIGLVISCLLQGLLLLPLRRPTARRHRGVSLWISVALGVLMTGLLLGGFAFAALDALQVAPRGGGPFLAGVAVAVAGWTGGVLLFGAYLRRHPHASREEIVHAMARRLLQGTAFETFALVPFDVMIRQRTDCYCAAGTVLAWAICFAVGLVVLGPAVLLPTLVRQRERWYRDRCDRCALPYRLEDARVAGYRGPIVDRCAACGLEGRPREHAARA